MRGRTKEQRIGERRERTVVKKLSGVGRVERNKDAAETVSESDFI